MKPLLLYLGLWAALPLASQAQAPQPALLSPPATYFTPDFHVSTSQDTAAFCAETTYRDSLGGTVRIYYPSGYLNQFIPYANVQRHVLHGTLSSWYEDGHMRTKEDYVAGKRQGDLLTYYPDGTLKRRDQCADGRCGVGTCYAPDGRLVPYFSYEQLPLYPGGEAELTKELTRGVKLNPQEMGAMHRESVIMLSRYRDQQWEVKREIFVELAVAEDGRVTDAEVVQSNTAFLNNAALRAVAKLKRQFVPARRDGQVVKSRYLVPIYFTMELPYRPPNYSQLPRRRWD